MMLMIVSICRSAICKNFLTVCCHIFTPIRMPKGISRYVFCLIVSRSDCYDYRCLSRT